MSSYFRLLSYLKKYKIRLFFAIICLLGATAAQLFLPWVIKDVIDKVFANKDMALLNMISIAILVIFIFRGFFVYGQQYLMTQVAQKVIIDIRSQLFNVMMDRRSLAYFEKNKTGHTMSFYTNDLNALQGAIVGSGVDFITELFVFIFSVASMVYIDWKLSLILFITIPIIGIIVDRLGKKIRAAGGQVQGQLAELTSLLQEVLSGIRVVKSFAREEYEKQRFLYQVTNNYRAVMRSTRAQALLTPIVEIFATIGVVMLIWYGGREVITGRLTSGELIAFLIYAINLSNPLKRISKTYAAIQSAMGAGDRIFRELDLKNEIEDSPDAKNIDIKCGQVQFEHVVFEYEVNAPILKDVSFTAYSGQKVALVGHSGAGKTTFVNLIPRFYDVKSGKILIDGIDIKTVTQKSLRNQIGIVPQETVLFSGSIYDNIRYGRLEANKEEIIQAAKAANVMEFVETLPEGFDTQVGERGGLLSGGQRQRVAIARAIIKNPQILILDEATSALDTNSEKLVQGALENLMEGRTSFVIAHRLSTILNSDVILVMKDGQIVEQGTHDKLIELQGSYLQLYETQFKKTSEAIIE